MLLIGVNLKIINMGMTNQMKFHKIFKKIILIKKDLQVAAIQKFTKVSIQDK
jgi:hypothetical protein